MIKQRMAFTPDEIVERGEPCKKAITVANMSRLFGGDNFEVAAKFGAS